MNIDWALLAVGISSVTFGLTFILLKSRISKAMNNLRVATGSKVTEITAPSVTICGAGFIGVGAFGIVGATLFPEAF